MDTATTDDLAVRIDRLRIEQGRTVLDLALASKVPLTTLQRRLAGDDKLTVSELYALSRVLQVPVSSWFEDAA